MPLLTPFTGDPNGLALKPVGEAGGTVEAIKLAGSGSVHLFALAATSTSTLLPWLYFAGRWYPHPVGAVNLDAAVNGGAIWDRFGTGDLRGYMALQKAGSGTLGDSGKARLEEVGAGGG